MVGSDHIVKYKLQAGSLVLAHQAKEAVEGPAWRQNTEQLRISVIIPVGHPHACMHGRMFPYSICHQCMMEGCESCRR